MRRTTGEKVELIRLVEGADLSVRQTLRELQLNRSTFYAWYRRYTQRGQAGLAPPVPAARRHWNRIPPRVRQQVVEVALADPERSPRELAGNAKSRTCADRGMGNQSASGRAGENRPETGRWWRTGCSSCSAAGLLCRQFSTGWNED